MKKFFLVPVILSLLFSYNCAHLRKKPQTGVEHQSATARFIGYKLTVRVKASPREIEQYLLNPENLECKAGTYALKMISRSQIEKLGDTARFKFEVAKLSLPFKFTFVYFKPGEEIWFLGQADIGVMGFFRFNYRPMEGGTRISLNYEMEDPNTFLGDLSEAINMPEAIVKLMEVEIAKGQEHFDPSLQADQLLKKGLRGEFYDTFFQTHQASIWINASPKRVQEYICNPQSRVTLWEKYGFDFGPCFISGEPGPWPVKFKIMGIQYDYDSFPASYKYGEHVSAYWVNRMGIARLNMTFKPDQGGTRFSFADMIELPAGIAEGGGNLIMSIMQVPAALEKDLLGIKNEVEGTG